MSNLITQTFKMGLPAGVPGSWFTKLDLFFKKKSTTFGCRVYLCFVENGLPNTEQIVPNSEVLIFPESINTSSNGTVATTCTFERLVYLERERRYGIVIVPLGAFPDYELWTAKVGETDIASNVRITSNPLLEGSFLTKNSLNWNDSASEDIKFTLYRAKFATTPATIKIRNKRVELIRPSNLNLSLGVRDILEGDEVWGWDANTATPVTSTFGRVKNYDPATNLIVLTDSSATFTANQVVTIVRPSTPGSLSGAGQIGLMTVGTIENLGYQSIVPRLGVNRQGGAIESTFRGASLSSNTIVLDATTQRIDTDDEFRFQSNKRVIGSATNERLQVANAYSIEMTTTFNSNSTFTSPFFTLSQANFVLMRQAINNDSTNEHTSNGNALSKYISKTVTLAEGQDAEDLRVFVSAFKPGGSSIKVYCRLLNGEDEQDFEDKAWTEMVQVENISVNSDPANQEDYREFTYGLPVSAATAPLPGAANGAVYVDSTYTPVPGIATYQSGGHLYRGYKHFAIKILLLSDTGVNTPRLNDVRAIALQL